MADNTTLNSGAGGDVISTDDLGASKVQRVKTQFGLDGYATDVSNVNPLPVGFRPGTQDVFGKLVMADASNDIDIQFYKGAPASLINVTTANSATAAANVGGALFSSSTNANGSVQGVTTQKTSYRSGSEIYCMFTAAFTAGIANSYMRIGLYDANEGFFLGYEGTSFEVNIRNNGSDTPTVKASFSEDPLTGGTDSLFTRDGVAEAIDLTKLNVFRIRFGWLGSAPVYWEVMAPDGHWVTFHKSLYPNLQAVPSIRNPDLPMTLDITKTAAAATDLTIQTDCWGAGISAGMRQLQQDEIAFSTTALLNNGASYNSGVLALSPEFSQVQTHVLASHDGDIDIYWYSDPGGTDQVRLLSIPYVASTGFQMFAAPAFTPYVKYVFTNDSGQTQTDFFFDTKFLRKPLSPQLLRVDGTVAAGMVASVQRSLITASNGSDYVNIAATTAGNLKVSIQELSDGLDVGAGNAGAETQRVSIATDDVNLSGILADTGAIQTAVEIIDDWDESDRAKVNLIVGQAGIAAGAGAVGVTVPRVTLASDDPAVALLGTIDTDTSSMATDLGTVAGAVAAGQVQVDIVADGADLLTNTNFAAAFGTAGTPDAQVMSVQGVASMTALVVDGSAVTQPVSNGGTFAVQAAQSGTWNITNVSGTVSLPTGAATAAKQPALGTAGSASSDVITVQGVASMTPLDVTASSLPAVAGEAASTMNASSSNGATALTNTAQAIKASAGSLKGYYIYNPNSSAQFVQFYNTASGSVTVGTTAPLFMITIPATSGANLWMQPGGVAFSTAMSWSATSTATGSGAPTTALDATCWYV